MYYLYPKQKLTADTPEYLVYKNCQEGS